MAGSRFYVWLAEHETGRYSKAHKHASAAVLICIKGKGYTYTWPATFGPTPWADDNAGKVVRQDYEPVGMVSAAPMKEISTLGRLRSAEILLHPELARRNPTRLRCPVLGASARELCENSPMPFCVATCPACSKPFRLRWRRESWNSLR